MSSFWRLLMASRINPSLLINSVYIRSAPLSLHTARKGGSLTSSIGASNKGKSGNSICSILTMTTMGYDGFRAGSLPFILFSRSLFLRNGKFTTLFFNRMDQKPLINYPSQFAFLLGLMGVFIVI